MDYDVDTRVRSLVAALNDLPGIWTSASCGGHEPLTNVSQVPADEFYVDFDIEPSEAGWRSLELIAQAAGEDREGSIRLTVWHDGGVRFDMHGYDGSDPEVLTERLVHLRTEPETSDA